MEESSLLFNWEVDVFSSLRIKEHNGWFIECAMQWMRF